MDTSLRLLPTGLENLQSVSAALAPQRAREEGTTTTPQTPTPAPSTQVSISEEGLAAARADVPAAAKTGEAGPATPVRPQAAVERAEPTARGEATPTANATLASHEAARRYAENANNLPIGQSGPSSVRISA
jgi:hypothetical protein